MLVEVGAEVLGILAVFLVVRFDELHVEGIGVLDVVVVDGQVDILADGRPGELGHVRRHVDGHDRSLDAGFAQRLDLVAEVVGKRRREDDVGVFLLDPGHERTEVGDQELVDLGPGDDAVRDELHPRCRTALLDGHGSVLEGAGEHDPLGIRVRLVEELEGPIHRVHGEDHRGQEVERLAEHVGVGAAALERQDLRRFEEWQDRDRRRRIRGGEGLDAVLVDELADTVHGGRDEAALVVVDDDLELGATRLLDLLGGEFGRAAHHLAIEGSASGHREVHAMDDGQTLAGLGATRAEDVVEHRAAGRRTRSGRSRARRSGRGGSAGLGRT